MVDLIHTKRGHIFLIGFHLMLGVLVKYMPSLVAMAYVGLFLWFVWDVVYTYDRNSRAGFYAIYLMGLEMVYRMAGAQFSWELGKYVCIIMFIIGLIIGHRKYIAWTFVLLLILLLPAMFLVEGSSSVEIRKSILFNMSGPLTLVMAGLYFFRRPIEEDLFYHQMRMAFLPAFTIIAALSVMANISHLEFASVQSSGAAAGGFGPNQVSTVLGWFILMVLLFKINKRQITVWNWLDWVMLFYLVLRALLTFSRGGVFGSLLAFTAAVMVLVVTFPSYRKQLRKAAPYILVGILFFIGVFFVANRITNNFLLYRYQGLTTTEVQTGVRHANRSVLTGRDAIIRADVQIFKDNPMLGVGYGMAEGHRARYYGQFAAAHTEFARLLSEHGISGVIFMLLGMIWLPITFFMRVRSPMTRFYFLAFYLLSMFTMFHAAMRLALPGVLFGAAFMMIKMQPKIESKTKEEFHQLEMAG
ncbi:O-antigen ligase family protein [Natronoflexus pectinivorans]|uniref:O-antigen ligase-like membrane protein n=1 Tax=Natronoflexus pectinivorans TaxID=682526 RepID=A0A4R2GFR8_9BACT|nr:O-antigen ligase family protein [Natronoflexus pectinivorans]TCO06860.1 O-antigen ligase-like membrane protein [Natronoflexus pectinivorans]